MAIISLVVLLSLWTLIIGLHVVDGGVSSNSTTTAAPSLSIQLFETPGQPCSAEFLNATGAVLYKYVNTTTAQVLKSMGYSIKTFPVNPVHIVEGVKSGGKRQRRARLLRGADETENRKLEDPQHDDTDSQQQQQQREFKSGNGFQEDASQLEPPLHSFERDLLIGSQFCKTCTRKACVTYCIGCYLCLDYNRRRAVTTTAPSAKAALTTAASKAAKTAQLQIQKKIKAHMKTWLTKGAGSKLVNGCMAPSNLTITVTLQ